MILTSRGENSAETRSGKASTEAAQVILAIGIRGLMEPARSPIDLEAKVVIEAPRGMVHHDFCLFPTLWSVSVCGLFLRTTHREVELAVF